MAGRRQSQAEKFWPTFDRLSILGSFLVGTATAGITATVWFTKNVATVPYVDSRTEEMRKYMDEKTADTLKSAFEHSDTNRRETALRIEQMVGDMKSMSVKQEMILDAIRSVQQQQSQIVSDGRTRR